MTSSFTEKSSSQLTQPQVRIHDVHKAFGAVKVLRGMSLAVGAGQAICVIGPSGSGKSTLLRCINGLIPVDRGEVFVGEHAVHTLKSDHDMIALRKDVSIVFQQYNLFPHKTALQNIMMAPIQVLGQNKDEVHERALGLLKKVRLEDKMNNYPGELSGGQQQRVAIARALAMQPSVMLFDEVADDSPVSRRGHDLNLSHARNGLRTRNRGSRVLHRSRCDCRRRHATADF